LEELRRGPWTAEEDLVLVEHVTEHGEGRWNALARRAAIHAAYCGFLSSSYVGPIAAPGRPPPPYSFGQPEQAIAPCTETAASSSLTSSKDSLPTTAQGDGMIQRGEEMLGVDGGGGGWAESQLPCPLNYDELGWESEDLLSGDYLWTVDDNWSMKQ
ncbi:hypothetical protein GW17_00048779, partial [Ensete ventricosum]